VGFKLLAVAALVCTVIAAGCGGSKKKSASPTTATSSSGAPRFATSKNCAQLEALSRKLTQALQTTSGSTEEKLTAEVKLFHDYANSAPTEVRGDFQTLADALDTYVHALLKAGIKPGKVPTQAQIAQIQAAAKVFSSQKLQAAERHLASWATRSCGTLTTTTG
jgi:hypothetical protein